MNKAITINNLSQKYGKHLVLEDLTLTFPENKVIGLLGPNGAGKTTLLKTIATILKPAAGSVQIFGKSIAEASARKEILTEISFLPQDFSADKHLTIRQFVEYNLWMRKFPRENIAKAAAEAIARVDLTEQAERKIRVLSGGMRQRAGIAAAIAGNPRLILLDEPTAGLDPAQRASFRALLAELEATIVISTHLIEDVESSANHLIVLTKGRVVHNGSPDILIQNGDRSVQALEAQYISLLER